MTGLGSFCPCLPTLKGLKSTSVTTARLIVEEAQGQDSGPTSGSQGRFCQESLQDPSFLVCHHPDLDLAEGTFWAHTHSAKVTETARRPQQVWGGRGGMRRESYYNTGHQGALPPRSTTKLKVNLEGTICQHCYLY